MRIFQKRKLIVSILMLFFLASFSITYAFWVSDVEGSSGIGDGSVGVGVWVPQGFIGVAQEATNGMITLNQIGIDYPLTGQPYIQMTDIDWGGNPFTPIGFSSQSEFSGEYHGNGFSITGININLTQTTGTSIYAGLFYQNAGIINQVSLIDINITVNKSLSGIGPDQLYVGGIAGQNTSTGNISNSYVTGSISGTSNITATGNGNQTITTNSFVGGIAGTNAGIIETSYSDASISSIANANVTSNNKNIFANSYAGGLVGRNENGGSVNKTYATGDVIAEAKTTNTGNKPAQATAFSYAGGLVGHNDLSTVANSFATGRIEAKTQTTGTATRYYGRINGLGISTNSYYLESQNILSTVISPGASGTAAENLTDSVTPQSIVNLRLESFIVSSLSWSANDWIFDSSYYPRLKRNKY